MDIRTRYIHTSVAEDLQHKMVFIGGPRQVGKTTCAKSFCKKKEEFHASHYLNWDILPDREIILSGNLPSKASLLILDEIHKFSDWRGLVKGFYDRHGEQVSILVTGSARLDTYRKGGDSLQGRYHYCRLHPFSILELSELPPGDAQNRLLPFGGFPEPLFSNSERFHRRWLREMSERITHEDVRDLERVRDVTRLDLLLHHLPKCVGSPLSVNGLRKLLQVSHASVENWLSIFERLYVCFRIPPVGGEQIRAVKKEQKLYFRDWSRVTDPGIRFENMVACHLLKYCDFIEDTEGYRMELRYLRDTDGREIDFVVLREGSPEFAVECNLGDRPLCKHIPYFKARTPIPEFYQVHAGEHDHGHAATQGRALPFWKFCQEKLLP